MPGAVGVAAVLALLGATLVGCDAERAARPAGAPGASAGAGGGGEAHADRVLARIDGEAITARDFLERLGREPPFVQARYSSPERRRELLESLVHFELLAGEARRRGLERDPLAVQRRKEAMVKELLARWGREAPPPTEAELAAHHAAWPQRFTRPEEVRVSQIFTRDKARAERAAALARALRPEDAAGFRALVARLSEDEDAKPRGGDLMFMDRAATAQPRAVVEAAFGLRARGEIAGPVASERGYHVLRLTERRAPALRPLAEVRQQVEASLQDERRERTVAAWVEEARARVKVEVYEEELRRLSLAGKPSAGGGARDAAPTDGTATP
jgi:peptidyl-prolyl cis-trans isomerase C